MHPILAVRQRLAFYLLAWLPIALLLTSILKRGMLSWNEAAIVAAPMCLAYAFVCLSAWYVCRAVPLTGGLVLRMVISVSGAALLAGSLWAGAGQAWACTVENNFAVTGLGDRYTAQIPAVLLHGVSCFFLAVAVHYVLIALEQSNQAQRRVLEMQVLAREAELKALRAQINPHFIFNSLNSINALTISDPERARRMCTLLAGFLRESLVLGGREQIPLAAEFSLVEAFLDIERIRYGHRLMVECHMDSQCGDCLVPPLLLQPLAENAVRHGIAGLLDGGLICIKAEEAFGMVEVVIRNPFEPEASAAAAGAGVGLDKWNPA